MYSFKAFGYIRLCWIIAKIKAMFDKNYLDKKRQKIDIYIPIYRYFRVRFFHSFLWKALWINFLIEYRP